MMPDVQFDTEPIELDSKETEEEIVSIPPKLHVCRPYHCALCGMAGHTKAGHAVYLEKQSKVSNDGCQQIITTDESFILTDAKESEEKPKNEQVDIPKEKPKQSQVMRLLLNWDRLYPKTTANQSHEES
jgi:hypothetical protein